MLVTIEELAMLVIWKSYMCVATLATI